LNDLQQVIESLPLQAYKWFRTEDEAYKPDGITDNRREYYIKKLVILSEHFSMYDYDYKIEKENCIADSHDITKSDMGFK